mgnify:CR=1 FL=1|tara:strand:+ start:86 stop:325 length:240 start_codon:yes stop_codon:yes gene_type:complete
MFPESLLEYASCVDGILLDWTGYQLQVESEDGADLPEAIRDCALMLLNAGWDKRVDPNVVVDAITDLLNTYDLDTHEVC